MHTVLKLHSPRVGNLAILDPRSRVSSLQVARTMRAFGFVVAIALTLGACGGGTGTGPDGGDGATAGAGIRVDWATLPAIGDQGEDVRIATATLQLTELRLLGDAAPGDARTSRTALTLAWGAGSAPPPLVFDQAPPGLYSELEFGLSADDGEDNAQAFDVTGQVKLNGELVPFTLGVTFDLTVSVPLSIDLAAGTSESFTVRADLGHVIDAVHWQDLPLVGGARVLDDSATAEVDNARKALGEAFTITVP